MISILIATDFSRASRNACMYGFHFARAIGAKIILFTAYQVSHQFAALDVGVSHFDARMQMKQKLEDEAKSISDDSSLLEIECEEGAPPEMIQAIAVEKEVDLIVVGLKGSGNLMNRLFGSTTTALINNLTLPVLVVPEASGFTTPRNIVYASDIFLDIKIMAIDQVQWLTRFFESTLSVVRVVSDESEKERETLNIPEPLRRDLGLLNTHFHFPVNRNPTAGLTDFVNKERIDMVLMLPRKHQWLHSFFGKSESMKMAFHAHLPILMLPHLHNRNVITGNLAAIETF